MLDIPNEPPVTHHYNLRKRVRVQPTKRPESPPPKKPRTKQQARRNAKSVKLVKKDGKTFIKPITPAKQKPEDVRLQLEDDSDKENVDPKKKKIFDYNIKTDK